jgi:putative hydrolase of the HAD superfamily
VAQSHGPARVASAASAGLPPPRVVEVVVLDHGGVLTRRSTAVLETFPERFGASIADFREAVRRVGRRLGRDPMVEVEVGRMTEADFQREVEAELPAGAHLDGFGAAYYDHLVPDDGALGFAAALRAAGYRTVAVANSAREWTPLWRERIGDVDALFDAVVTSSEVGARKPDPTFFLALLERVGVAPQRCLLVDDAEDCCRAAEALGMHAVLVADPGEVEPAVLSALRHLTDDGRDETATGAATAAETKG